jgi:hypothetical protein
MIVSTVNAIPTSTAAKFLGISADRVRQLCAEHNIGTLLNPRARMLFPEDIAKLREVLSEKKPGGWPRGVARKKT